jgi:hypothetical protein
MTVMMIEALIGVDRLSPSKKRIWFNTTPNIAQTAILNKSRFSTFSDGMIKCNIPNTANVTSTRRKIIALGIM